MSSHFANILKHAKLTCDPINAISFKNNFNILKQLVDKLKATDLAVNPELFSQKHFNRPNKAPCTYVNIYECDICTISVFILAESYTMPIHDHPNIHGIIKTIAGKIRLQSYTAVSSLNAPTSSPAPANNEQQQKNNASIKQNLICVVSEPAQIITTKCDGAVLTPNERNYHEITAIDGPAAFFDILTPPYDTTRKCSFYEKFNANLENVPDGLHQSLDENYLYLKRIPCPQHYFCDNVNDFS